ncbi:HPr kinase/phosphorylase [Aquibium carbonis]|uniref:HPr kinase/phosphorylase n=1 Tax=Aquibium carbonis TaxID=2495581 RepID=A0A3S0A444_9HYPH|nr:HPr kinase/phosphorylase [Aquibium carbonis]RST88437.1 HPr kinase/phosphorylase [Aquibium carbonis]
MHNIHATGVILRDRGVLITGPSGSGKSTLALDLLDRVRMAGGFARIVCDDQMFVQKRSGRLLARAAATIGGLVEIRGIGPCAVDAEPAMEVDLVVRLVPAATAPRIWDGETATVEGIVLPRLDLPERGGTGSVAAVQAFLALSGVAIVTPGAAK